MAREIKACPFCGGALKFDERKLTMGAVNTKCHCEGCGMEFAYTQEFAYSKKSRVPLNDSFETTWNNRLS